MFGKGPLYSRSTKKFAERLQGYTRRRRMSRRGWLKNALRLPLAETKTHERLDREARKCICGAESESVTPSKFALFSTVSPHCRPLSPDDFVKKQFRGQALGSTSRGCGFSVP